MIENRITLKFSYNKFDWFVKIDFNKTDGGSLCKIINRHAYNWALYNVGATTV